MSKFVTCVVMVGLCMCGGKSLFAGCGCEDKSKKEEAPKKCNVVQPKEDAGATGATGTMNPSDTKAQPEKTDSKY
jgi:hypothetical protein